MPNANSVDDMAVQPNGSQRASEHLQNLATRLTDVASYSNDYRLEVLKSARALVQALETPMETIIRHCWEDPTRFAAIETAIGMNLFTIMAEQPNGRATVKTLNSTLGGEYNIVSRILRHLATFEIVLEIAPEEYQLTNLARTLSVPRYADAYGFVQETAGPACSSVAQYLSRNGWKSLASSTDCPFQLGHNTSAPMFKWMQQQPLEVYTHFNNHMTTYHNGRPSWMDESFYPVQERLVEGAIKDDPNAVFMVDIGGGKGQDLIELFTKHPSANCGHSVLQELEVVTRQVVKESLPSNVRVMVHDFLTEQPIHGARSYFFHSILHNWPDDVCRRILSQIVPVMTPGYSKILINDTVIPERDASSTMTGLDIMMLALLGAAERREDEWRTLVESCGLKLVGIYGSNLGALQCLIECELA